MQTTRRSFDVGQWKPEETTGNDWGVQRDIGGVVEVPPLRALGAEVLPLLQFSGALSQCLLHRGLTEEEVAKRIHICKGYMSKLLGGVWEAQIKRLVRFMRQTNCIAPLQWMAFQLGCEVVVRSAQSAHIAKLEAELAAARRAAA